MTRHDRDYESGFILNPGLGMTLSDHPHRRNDSISFAVSPTKVIDKGSFTRTRYLGIIEHSLLSTVSTVFPKLESFKH